MKYKIFKAMSNKTHLGITYFTEGISYVAAVSGLATFVYGVVEKDISAINYGLVNSVGGIIGAIISKTVRGHIKKSEGLESRLRE